MSKGPHRQARHGRTKTQSLVLLAAQSGKLFKQARPYELVMRQPQGHFVPVRTFGKQAVKECEKAGWIAYHDQGDGSFRIMTTPAGDRALLEPLRRVTPQGGRLDAAWRAEALR
jgi:hypothetical protein